jgi:hypothetical protein
LACIASKRDDAVLVDSRAAVWTSGFMFSCEEEEEEEAREGEKEVGVEWVWV